MGDIFKFRFHVAVLAMVAVLFCPGCHSGIAKPDITAVVGGITLDSISHTSYLVAIYKKVTVPGETKLVCSGTLISTVHVVTAAHCFWNDRSGVPYDPANYEVTAGKIHRDLDFFGDLATGQRKDVANLTLHRRYLGSAQSQAYDIAVVTLDSPVTLTGSVCVADVDWYDEWTEEQMTSGSNGTVAGWGISDTGLHSTTVQYVALPYVDPDTCFDSLPRVLKKFVTHDKFCAGFLNRNTSVCPGDSGGGLVFYHPGTGKNFLRGVVSMAFRPAGNRDLCYAQHYTAFTKVTSEVLQVLLGHVVLPRERTRGFLGERNRQSLNGRHPGRSRDRTRGYTVVDSRIGSRRVYDDDDNGGRRAAGAANRRS